MCAESAADGSQTKALNMHANTTRECSIIMFILRYQLRFLKFLTHAQHKIAALWLVCNLLVVVMVMIVMVFSFLLL